MHTPRNSPFISVVLFLSKYLCLLILGIILAWLISMIFNAEVSAEAVFKIVLPWILRLIWLGGCIVIASIFCESLN